MKEKNNHPVFELKNQWENFPHHVWLASTLTLSRNLQKYKFPPKLNKEREQQIVSLIFESLSKTPDLKNPRLLRSAELDPLDREFLLEHFLVGNEFYHAHAGEGFVIDENADFLATLNLNEHLQLCLIDTQQEIEKSWNRLVKIEGHLGKTLDFSFHPKFGFLTSNPRRSGTALSICLFLHIPAVIHMGELPELLEREKEEEVEAVGLQGRTHEMVGDILVAHNNCSLGLTEEYILTTMRMWATRAVVAELSMRKKLMESGSEAIKNKVTRALGLLTHSYQLEAVEALNAVSLVKLGIEVGWISAPSSLNMNDILFNCRRAHLIESLNEKVDITELPRKRAAYLHGIASTLTLNI